MEPNDQDASRDGTNTEALYCAICERDVADLPPEMAVVVRDVCVSCWLESVPEIHAPDEIPEELRPLLSREARTPKEAQS